MVKSPSLPRRMLEEMEMAMNYLYLVLLLILGIFMTLKPDLMWKLEHFLSTKGGEPSELYRVMTVFGGIGLILAALVLFFLSLAI